MDITPAMSANAAVCRAAAAGSMVLLKNTNNALPFEKNEDGSPLPIAVFGEADGPVRVELAGNAAEAAPRDGRFCATLPPLPAVCPRV